jgi:hypothetical protein
MPPEVPCGDKMAVDGAPRSDTNSFEMVPLELFGTIMLTWASASGTRRIRRTAPIIRSLKRKRGGIDAFDIFIGPQSMNDNNWRLFIPKCVLMSTASRTSSSLLC